MASRTMQNHFPEQTTRKEAKRLQDIGIWYHNPNAAWAAPSTFIQPKKTGDVRILTDLRELNKWIVRKPYPLPKIQDMLQKLKKFSNATPLDLSMGYYHIPLDKEARVMYYNTTMGKVLIREATHGTMKFTRYFPSSHE